MANMPVRNPFLTNLTGKKGVAIPTTAESLLVQSTASILGPMLPGVAIPTTAESLLVLMDKNIISRITLDVAIPTTAESLLVQGWQAIAVGVKAYGKKGVAIPTTAERPLKPEATVWPSPSSCCNPHHGRKATETMT